jgi:hypothetical protein
MSRFNRHESSPLRVIPKLPRLEAVDDVTSVDVKKAPPRRDAEIPSLTGRSAKGTTPPPNVIPFMKPRAMSAIAAENPNSIVIAPSKPAPIIDTAERKVEAATKFSPTSIASSARKRSGWTPPAPVKSIAPMKSMAPVTAFPSSASSTTMPVQLPVQSVPTPMQQPLKPVVEQKPVVVVEQPKPIAAPS